MPRTVGEFIQAFQAMQPGPTVTFHKRIEDCEGYAEKGMKARITKMRVDEDDVAFLTVDYSEFDAHNAPLETPNYYDKSGSPRLTARQAGQYRTEEDLCLNASDPLGDYLEPDDAKVAALLQEYAESASTSSYLSWLQSELLKARGLA